MNVIDPGHVYAVSSLDGELQQHVVFVKRIGPHYPGNAGSPHAGTTSQELLRVLLDRARYVNGQIACCETEAMIGCLQTALALLEMRAKRVKGKGLELQTLQQLEAAGTCKSCGHVDCKEHP